MQNTDSWEHLKQDTPARYRIRIHEHLDPSWSERLGNMVITRAYTEEKKPMTILVGILADQSALSGVLNTLLDLNFQLLSVENLDLK